MYNTFIYKINIRIKSKFKITTYKNLFISSDFFYLNTIKKLCFFIFILHIYKNCYLLLNFNFKKIELFMGINFFLFSEEQFLKKFYLK